MNAAQAPARAADAGGGPTSPGGVKRLMDLDALSGEIDADMDHLDGGADSEMPSAEAGTTMTPDTTGEVASALGVLTGAAQAVGGLVGPGWEGWLGSDAVQGLLSSRALLQGLWSMQLAWTAFRMGEVASALGAPDRPEWEGWLGPGAVRGVPVPDA